VKDGFIKVAAATPTVKVADPVANAAAIGEKIDIALEQGARIVVFPELCVTGYTCGDLFWQESLLNAALEQLLQIAAGTEGKSGIVFVGLPLPVNGKLYNVAAAISNGKVIGLVPKTYLPNYNEFYEARYFTSGSAMPSVELVTINEHLTVPMGTKLLFTAAAMPELKIAAEICEDLWHPSPPSTWHALAGANVIVNLSASNEVAGKNIFRDRLVSGQSARLMCGYVYATAGDGESTQDVVFSGHNLIYENGSQLSEARRFVNDTIYGEMDIKRLLAERRRVNTVITNSVGYTVVPFHLELEETSLSRQFRATPFIPANQLDCKKRCDEILTMQAFGLKKRLQHIGCTCAVLGVSGGLDSTLALLVTVRAFDLLHLPRKGIYGITMPGFGTTDRTYDNAVKLIKCLDATFLEIDIKAATKVHFLDIGQDENKHDITYENAQARERTQILMDIANQNNGLVIGTGDMSEMALGWATYNGDHMSMYGVNASVPKTLVRHLVENFKNECSDTVLHDVLTQVLGTPVSPELLPPQAGKISQITEDIVGPYELHDFYLYYMLRFGFTPKKIFRIAADAFAGQYEEETILSWLKVFYRRFFNQQFKRSCVPDGPKVGMVALSPRGDLRMPSDACVRIWMDELEEIKVIE
jgi:NAD+ synthase (glutamine-hydrolysing)